jgi:hypothetical protein
MKIARKPLAMALTAAVLLCAAAPAAAQWAWRDATGRMVYSDQPPPKSVPARDIVRQPPAPPARAAASDEPREAAKAERASQSAAPRTPSVAEREIESRRRQQQIAEAEKKAAEEEARKAKVAENCERLRGYLKALEGGFRVARINAEGRQEFIDAPTRSAEIERTRGELAQQCP